MVSSATYLTSKLTLYTMVDSRRCRTLRKVPHGQLCAPSSAGPLSIGILVGAAARLLMRCREAACHHRQQLADWRPLPSRRNWHTPAGRCERNPNAIQFADEVCRHTPNPRRASVARRARVRPQAGRNPDRLRRSDGAKRHRFSARPDRLPGSCSGSVRGLPPDGCFGPTVISV